MHWLFAEQLCKLQQKLSLFAEQESTIFLRMCRMQFEQRGLSFMLWFSDDACLRSWRDVFYCFFNIISIYYICYDLTMMPLLLQEGSHYLHSQVFLHCIGIYSSFNLRVFYMKQCNLHYILDKEAILAF